MPNVLIRKAQANEYTALLKIDEAANTLFEGVGIQFEFEDNHPFVLEESKRWQDALQNGRIYFAVDEFEQLVGFIILGQVDGQPYLDQISVHPDCMGQGIGLQLLHKAIELSGDEPLWLTTYAHVVWNKPFYEKHGFKLVNDELCGPEVCAALQQQRLFLPFPEQRVAMVRKI